MSAKMKMYPSNYSFISISVFQILYYALRRKRLQLNKKVTIYGCLNSMSTNDRACIKRITLIAALIHYYMNHTHIRALNGCISPGFNSELKLSLIGWDYKKVQNDPLETVCFTSRINHFNAIAVNATDWNTHKLIESPSRSQLVYNDFT